VNLLKLLVAQIPGEVYSENLCADDGIEFADFDRLVSHEFPSLIFWGSGLFGNQSKPIVQKQQDKERQEHGLADHQRYEV
jgi:hypothetical protein